MSVSGHAIIALSLMFQLVRDMQKYHVIKDWDHTLNHYVVVDR